MLTAKVPGGGRVYAAIGDDWIAVANVRELMAKTLGLLTGSGDLCGGLSRFGLDPVDVFGLTRRLDPGHLLLGLLAACRGLGELFLEGADLVLQFRDGCLSLLARRR